MPGKPKQMRGFKLGTRSGDRFERKQKEIAMSTFYRDERILEDDYPIYGDYLYLADGRVYRSDWHDVTVAELKRREGFKEVRNCSWERFE